MSAAYEIGQTLKMVLTVLDQHGNPIDNPPAPDSPPAWSNQTPATETLTVDASGLTASASGVAPGTDTIVVSAIIGGQHFAGTLDVTVTAAVQVPSGARIDFTVQ